MSLKTHVFDPARYRDSDEALAAYLTEALKTGNPAFIADALGVIARAGRLERVHPDWNRAGVRPFTS
jgi:probable addiction module antidote protein